MTAAFIAVLLAIGAGTTYNHHAATGVVTPEQAAVEQLEYKASCGCYTEAGK